MNFYHNLITKKSWDLLEDLAKEYEFILIGGWAVFLYTKALKSKDIDLVLEYPELEKLKNEFEITKNERLKKYQARKEEIEIDIYLPFYSNPGLPAEDLKKFQTIVGGFKVVEKEVLAILKQKALKERENSVKGRKDLADLLSLFSLKDFDWEKYKKIIGQYGMVEYLDLVKRVIQRTSKFEELNLNVYQMAKLKKRILSFLKIASG